MADTAAAPKVAPAAKAAAPAKTDREKQLEAEVGALRAELAQRHEEAKRERRTSDPTSEAFDARLAVEEAWPAAAPFTDE